MSTKRNLALSLLREPQQAVRTAMDQGALEELAVSMRNVGVIEPLIVTPAGDGTFEVVAGHRRMRAAELAGLMEVPCLIETDQKRLLAIKIHENAMREDMSPVDEAGFYWDLFRQLGEDTQAVAAAVRRTVEHVEARMNLMRGDERVLVALRGGQISLGVAEELNRMKDPQDVDYYLGYAVRAGATKRQMAEWRSQANTRRELEAAQPPAPAAAPPPGAGPGDATPAPSRIYAGALPWQLSTSEEPRPCLFCQEPHREWEMLRYYVCRGCVEHRIKPVEDGRA